MKIQTIEIDVLSDINTIHTLFDCLIDSFDEFQNTLIESIGNSKEELDDID
jgi:hypothetical protein